MSSSVMSRGVVAAIVAFAAVVAPRAAAAEEHPPAAPVIVSPRAGEVVPVLRPVLIARAAVDPDGDPLVYDWAIAPDATFALLEAEGEGVAPTGTAFAGLDVGVTLAENTRHCWRVRARDAQATGPYAAACFVASAVNDPPTVPEPLAPSELRSPTTLTPVCSWEPSADVEGEPVTYEVELRDAEQQVLQRIEGVHGAATVFSHELANGAEYAWRVRAVDRSGAASEPSRWATFWVAAPVDDPEVTISPGGCAAGGAGGGAPLVLVGLGLAAWRGARPRARARR